MTDLVRREAEFMLYETEDRQTRVRGFILRAGDAA
jgi:hypothetical protein